VADLDAPLSQAHRALASLYEVRGDYDKAIDRYHRILASDPQDLVALNKLAYALAERKQNPKEALPLAERAYKQSPTGTVADTLGWIHHLLGDDRSAGPLLERAVLDSPDIAEIQLHAAIVHSGLNDLPRARQELAAAEKLDPGLAERADVKALRSRLQ